MSSRALLTTSEREVLADTRGGTEYETTVRTRLRSRLANLEADIEVLEEHEPDVLNKIKEIVC